MEIVVTMVIFVRDNCIRPYKASRQMTWAEGEIACVNILMNILDVVNSWFSLMCSLFDYRDKCLFIKSILAALINQCYE